MTVWAIADLHLAFSDPSKDMAFFGPSWANYADRIATQWKELIAPDDIVLIAGDISWAMKAEQALIDLEWIDALPGTKVCIRGNHDYWWSSKSKVNGIAPPSLHFLQHDAFNHEGISISGTRLWDTPEYNFNAFITFTDNPKQRQEPHKPDPKIFDRELHRLDLAVKSLDPSAHTKIIMTHYPPIGADLVPSRASALLRDIDYVIFGHLHAIEPATPLFGTLDKTNYLLTSADYLDFRPIKVC